MLPIDGSQGEGGGQVLRSALALSMVTGAPFRIGRIRAGRRKPGLMRQHLTAVRAAKEVCNATVEGDAVGATALAFEPADVRAGDYHFAVGTAGSATLVLQTVLPALVLADGPSTVVLEGGTHNPFAPPFDFLARAFLPLLNRMGPKVTLELERPGFYPAGGGRFTVHIEPTRDGKLCGIELLERGEDRGRCAMAVVANLPRHIAERELKKVQAKLGWAAESLEVIERHDALGPGNIVMLAVESEHVTELFTGFGEKNVPSEKVASQAAEACRRYLTADVPVGEHLADQLLLPLAIAGHGAFRTVHPSRHTQTHVELIGKFLDVPVSMSQEGRDRWLVTVGR
ncbi:MAG: RNA 3'-terminal phosphate cyclase [Phycisphaeraceae bacterium]